MQVLYRLATGGPCVVVAPVAALMQKLPPWELFADSVRTITIGQQMDPDALRDILASAGYEHTSTVTRVGEFSRRGGIVDFFSPAHEHPSAWSSSAILSSPFGPSIPRTSVPSEKPDRPWRCRSGS